MTPLHFHPRLLSGPPVRLPDELALRGLQHLAELRVVLDRIESELAQVARPWATWEEVGAALGITRQAAYRRHRGVVRPPRALPPEWSDF